MVRAPDILVGVCVHKLISVLGSLEPWYSHLSVHTLINTLIMHTLIISPLTYSNPSHFISHSLYNVPQSQALVCTYTCTYPIIISCPTKHILTFLMHIPISLHVCHILSCAALYHFTISCTYPSHKHWYAHTYPNHFMS